MDEERGISEREQEDSFWRLRATFLVRRQIQNPTLPQWFLFDTLRAPTPSVLARKKEKYENKKKNRGKI